MATSPLNERCDGYEINEREWKSSVDIDNRDLDFGGILNPKKGSSLCLDFCRGSWATDDFGSKEPTPSSVVCIHFLTVLFFLRPRYQFLMSYATHLCIIGMTGVWDWLV